MPTREVMAFHRIVCASLFVLSSSILETTFVGAAPTIYFFPRDDAGNATTSGGFQEQNGLDAQKLNAQFASISPSDPCQGMSTLAIK